MLPWEHAAIAYLLYSGYARWRTGAPPAGWPVLVVLFASQLPDLIDKPLAWHVGILPHGRSLGHSVFFGVPLSLGVITLARRRGRPELGPAFAIGYLSHLATDAVPLYPGASTSFESILWPVVTREPTHSYEGFLERTQRLLVADYPSILELEPSANALVGIAMVGVLLVIWILDGAPGRRELSVLVRWPIERVRSR